MKPILTLAIIVSAALFISCNGNDDTGGGNIVDTTLQNGIPAPQQINYTIIAQHPHDTSAYTQGLELHNGKMYEGTGYWQESSIRITDYKTGKVEKKHMMGTENIFGEGITILNNKLYQLTWESNIAYVYDLNDITKPIKTFTWPHDGWGITNNGTDLIISDGSNTLYFVNPEDFKIKSTIAVNSNFGPVQYINELEWIDGFVWANVYETTDIIKINPENGHVVGKFTFPNLPANERVNGRTDFFNGIAYDSATKTMLLTGKRWPKMYEVKIN